MAIQDQPTPGFAQPGTSAPAAAQVAAAPMQQRAGISLLNMGHVGGLVRSGTSEALTKGFTAVQDSIKDSRISAVYKVHGIQIDNEAVDGLRFASIVLAIRHESTGLVAHHTLILEASAEPVSPKMEVIGQVQVTIDRFAAQAYDSKYIAAVEKTIATAFPNQTLLNTGATVVPRIFNWTDREATRELVSNALMAAVTYLEARLPGFADLDMSQVTTDSTLQVQVTYENPETIDYTGLPVRSDISIVTTAVPVARKDDGSLNNQADSVCVSRVTGFIDLTYVPSNTGNQVYGQVNPAAKRIYQPRFVITKLENMLRLTPAAQLLALVSACMLGEGTNYYRAFKPSSKPANKDPRDIGAVNIEANLNNEPGAVGTKIDTKAANFGEIELGTLIQAVMHPGLAISIDVNDCGSDTWYNRQFVAASTGDPTANGEILRAANVLTGGHFQRLYGNSNIPAVLVTDERVLMGYYVGPDGQRTDVREVDYLAVANKLGVTNPKAIVDWSETVELVHINQALRLQGRRTIIKELCEQLTFTQYGTRVTLHPKFLELLLQALKECGVGFKMVNTGVMGNYLVNRGGGLMSQAALGINQSGVFNQGGFGGAQNVPFNRPGLGQSMF